MKNRLKSYQIIYCSILLVAALAYFFLPEEYIGNDPSVLYWINLYSIVTGLGGMFLTLRMFAFKGVNRSVKDADETRGENSFCRWTGIRLMVLAWALWSNVALYLATSYTSTPKYCTLIILVAFVFCWPSVSEYVSVRGGSVQQ